EAANFRRFFTRIEKGLQTETNSQKRHIGIDAFGECRAHFHLVKRAHHLAEMAYARQYDFRRFSKSRRITHQTVTGADLPQRVFYRTQIPRAVIENGDHKRPLVD